MLDIDQDALTCDLAETYHIYDLKELPLRKVALFSCGLRENSRIKQKMANSKVSFETLILANINDMLAKMLGIPSSIVDKLIDDENKKDDIVTSFDNADEFEKAKKEILEGYKWN